METNEGRDGGIRINKASEILFYHLLETELGGVEVYTAAIKAVQNEELREEWNKYLEETRRHVDIARRLLEVVGLDPDAQVPARQPVHMVGEMLVKMIETAAKDGPEAGEIAACEAVVFAETKDHMNWELLSELSKGAKGDIRDQIREACDEVEEQEDRHLYHTKGWARELWLQALGLPAVIPPPEEKKDVTTAIAAEKAKQGRTRQIRPRSRMPRSRTRRR